jgi:hypothetical protein
VTKRSSSILSIWRARSSRPSVSSDDVFVTKAVADIHREIAAFCSHTGLPSVDTELMIRRLIVGYCYGKRSERLVFECVVGLCLAAGLIRGDVFAVDASVIEDDASRSHGIEPEKIDWPSIERPTRAVRKYLLRHSTAPKNRYR